MACRPRTKSPILLGCGGDTPHRTADIVGNKQSPLLVDSKGHRAAVGRVTMDETCQNIMGHAVGLAIAEGDENHLVAVQLATVPTAMLADEGAAAIRSRKIVGRVEHQAEGRDMAGKGVVWRNRLGYQIRAL